MSVLNQIQLSHRAPSVTFRPVFSLLSIPSPTDTDAKTRMEKQKIKQRSLVCGESWNHFGGNWSDTVS